MEIISLAVTAIARSLRSPNVTGFRVKPLRTDSTTRSLDQRRHDRVIAARYRVRPACAIWRETLAARPEGRLEGLRREAETVAVTADDVREYLGPPRFYLSRRVGVTCRRCDRHGLDEMAAKCCSSKRLSARRSWLTITGHSRGEQESARAAQSYLWSHAAEFGLSRRSSKSLLFRPARVPAGRFRKDGQARA